MTEERFRHRRSRRVMQLAVTVLVAMGIVALTGVAGASITQTAPAVVTQPDTITALSSGGSTTEFTLVVPANSHCSKDTSTFNYHVFSYVVSSSVDPGTLTFGADGTPSQGFQLWDINGNPFGPFNTAINSGDLAQAPSLNWTLFTPAGTGGLTFALPPGTYNVGIACGTNTGAIDQFWNVQFAFTASTSDPNGEVWTVVGATTTTTSTTPGATTTSTSSTTIPGATTTSTSTTVPGATTTSSSSTVPGATTTSSTVAGASTTTSTGAVASGNGLASTGSRVEALYYLGVFLVVLGMTAALFADRRRRAGGGR